MDAVAPEVSLWSGGCDGGGGIGESRSGTTRDSTWAPRALPETAIWTHRALSLQIPTRTYIRQIDDTPPASLLGVDE